MLVAGLLGTASARPGPEAEAGTGVAGAGAGSGGGGGDIIHLAGDLGIKLFPFPHLTRARDAAASSGGEQRRTGFFSANPLTSVQRSFQVTTAQYCNILLLMCRPVTHTIPVCKK